MKIETMTPQWVVENFLPDYEERYRDYYEVDIDNDLSRDYELEYPDWIDKHFPEALSQLLKAQKEVCADNAKIQRVVVGHNGTNNEFGYMVDRESIINAPIPEPKNRK